jgi:hypothetical protein
MSQALDEWKVCPHGRLQQVNENILAVVGEIKMPLTTFPRRMTAVRLKDGRLVIFSAVSLDEDGMRELEAFGRPAFLVVPNDHHRLDAMAWKQRYPDIVVIGPKGSREKIEKEVPVDAVGGDFGDPDVTFVTVPGTDEREAALEVNGADGLTLVLNDIVGNVRGSHGVGGWMLRKMGFAGDEPHVPGPVKFAMVEDKAALRAQLLRWAQRDDLKRILVAHGDTIDENPRATLRELAAELE